LEAERELEEEGGGSVDRVEKAGVGVGVWEERGPAVGVGLCQPIVGALLPRPSAEEDKCAADEEEEEEEWE
jgi:hypothetical protein